MSALEARHEVGDGLDSLVVVGVVEDHEPGRIVVKLLQHGFNLDCVLRRFLLREIQHQGSSERGKARVKRGSILRAHEQQHRIVGLAPMRIFDREARLTDPAEPIQRPSGHRCALPARERRAQVIERCVATHKQGPERGEGQVSRLTGEHSGGLDERVDHCGAKNLRDKIVDVGEFDLRVAAERPQSLQMRRLCGLTLLGRREVRRER